jgi:hypothetical protein
MTRLRWPFVFVVAVCGFNLHAGEVKTGFINMVHKGKDGDLSTAEKIKHIPTWAFCGDLDKPFIEPNRNMFKALKAAGGEPRYSEYPFVGHNSLDSAYATEELYTWFLKQSTK